MPSRIFKSSVSSGGKGVTSATPTLSHGPTAGTFVIDNYDSRLRYVLTTGSRSGNTITLGSSGTIASQILTYSEKGAIASSAKSFDRKDYTYSYVQTGTTPQNCNYLPSCGGPYDTGAGCANCGGGSGGLCIYCSGGDPIYGYVKDGTPSGYTDSYGEWWRIL